MIESLARKIEHVQLSFDQLCPKPKLNGRILHASSRVAGRLAFGVQVSLPWTTTKKTICEKKSVYRPDRNTLSAVVQYWYQLFLISEVNAIMYTQHQRISQDQLLYA